MSDNVIVHEAAKRSWWDGSVTMVCGRKFPAGKHEAYVFVKVNCPACLRALGKS
jgi:hypothetical protein